MKKQNNGKLRIIPLGGLEQIGMNITAFEYEDSIVVVDCGLAFPEDDMLGIDLVIPDVTYLKDNASKVKGFVITHGHEDHIGALPYVLKEINLPIYTTKLTMGIIENKLKEHNLLRTTKRKVVRHGQSINLGKFRIEFIKTNHSIQDASALAIYSPAGVVIHTGDFKVDYTPVFGDAIDLQRFAEIGKKGVLALMSDSTNAERRGFTQSEKTVGITFDHIFAEHQNTRLIIATFASNVDRVQQIINSAYKYGRKVVVEGRSMVNIIATASELGYLDVPENTLIEIDQMKNYPPEKMVLITTGSQGESMAALSRMAADVHRKVTIQPNDTIIFSSNPIPGNEKSVSRVINELSSKGAAGHLRHTVGRTGGQHQLVVVVFKHASGGKITYRHLAGGCVDAAHLMAQMCGDALRVQLSLLGLNGLVQAVQILAQVMGQAAGAAGVEAAFFVDGDLRSALGGGKSGGGRNPGGNAADDNNFHCLSLTIPPGGSPSLRQNLQGVTYSGWEDCPRCPR